MKGVLLDTKTGIKKTIPPDWEMNDWWWAHGNGCCDCNRAIIMDCEDEMDAIMRKNCPGLADDQTVCYGATRFLIVESNSKVYPLRELNDRYPRELIEKWCL